MAYTPAVPIPNTYWVIPGRLLAGEYPRDRDEATSRTKLQALHDAGIRTFIDLTCDAHLKPYDVMLADACIRHSVPVRDWGIPPDAKAIHQALDVIDHNLAQGRGVYVHCWGGIGRTGTLVGCWLSQHGLHGDTALQRLAVLWQTCSKSSRYPQSPQTAEQCAYVREWHKSDQTGDDILSRAQGCLLGQLAGDALGSLVEFQSAQSIAKAYPHGVRDMHDGGTWNTIAGQPTDDSEMALALARSLVREGRYEAGAAMQAYQSWRASNPFDCGTTIGAALRGQLSHSSQANGALMRVSPLGIFGWRHAITEVAQWARQDASLTHPNPVCKEANALFAAAIGRAIATGCSPQSLYVSLLLWAHEWEVDPALLQTIERAADAPPEDFHTNAGWVLVAFQNALWQLLHAPSLQEAIVDTIGRGGDTDTNAAICGALLGAVHGRNAIPQSWVDTLLQCRPDADNPKVCHPRPQEYWPVDALELARALVGPGSTHT